MQEKIPNMRKTPTGYIGLSSRVGVIKSCKRTTISSVIMTAPRATSVQTSVAYIGARGPIVNWNRKDIRQMSIRSAMGESTTDTIAIPTRAIAMPPYPIRKIVRLPTLDTK